MILRSKSAAFSSGELPTKRPSWRRGIVLLVIVGSYWLCALWLLIRVSPISVDGSGATATLYWGESTPDASLREFEEDAAVRRRFLRPYWIAASIVTLIGCGLALWVTRCRRRCIVASIGSFSLLLVAGAVSDLGIALRLWTGPAMSFGFSYALPFLEVFVPLSLLAGLACTIARRLGI